MTAVSYHKATLGELSSLITSGSRDWAKYYSDEGALFLRMTNLPKEGIRLLLKDKQYVSLPSSSQEGRRTSVLPNDILISITAELGKIGFVEDLEIDEAYVNQHIALVRLSSPLAFPAFVAYYLSDEKQRRQLQRLNDSGAKSGLNLQTIDKFQVTLPPFEDQRRIAQILSTWDTTIERTDQLIKAKQRYLTWFSNLLLFGKQYENGHFHNNKWFSVPKHWEIKRIGQIAHEINLTNNSGENLPVLSCTKYEGLVDSLKYFDKRIFSEDTSKYKVVKKGQFAYATNHIEEGSIGYQDFYPKGLVSPMYTVFETDDIVIDGYLYKVLKTDIYRHIFEINTSASVDRRGSLRWSQFSSLPIPLPPLREQEEIDNTLNLALEEIELLKQQAEAYRKQKRGLMQKLLTGQWRIKGGLEETG
jgi:type I restriction enzyme S subunit